jgi:TadE-like protein
MTKRLQRGSTMIEMTLVGIPLIFILISVFEVSRGMWMYHTLAYAVKEGVRYAIVHGKDCDPAQPMGNNCLKNMSDIAQVIRNAGTGLDLDTTQLRFCAPGPCASTTWDCTKLTNCPNTTWPPAGSNGIGQTIEIDITTPFRSATAMFWPGAGYASIGVANFVAASNDWIQF